MMSIKDSGEEDKRKRQRIDPPLSIERALQEVENIQALAGLVVLPTPVEAIPLFTPPP
jgi:hypothetical protein